MNTFKKLCSKWIIRISTWSIFDGINGGGGGGGMMVQNNTAIINETQATMHNSNINNCSLLLIFPHQVY